ncbi:hypothetical protein ACLOJK_001650 [Asimina triloba]
MAMFRLPYAHVDTTLRALAGQAEGFGRAAIGGLHGPVYHVTSLAGIAPPLLLLLYMSLELTSWDNKDQGRVMQPTQFIIVSYDGIGSLRAGCRRQEPLWIVFEVSGTIHLNSYLNVSSYKTIDGRGQRIKLMGKGLRLKECEHVIVCNLEFEGGRGPDVDGIQIKPNSRHIWIDRCTLSDFDDGLIDITRESTDITVSRHDKTMLIGADAKHVGDRCMRVTIHHCFFDGTRQRHPRVRFAKVHLYNNYTRNWGIYAVCASVESQILSQHNIYEAGQKKVVFKYMPEKLQKMHIYPVQNSACRVDGAAADCEQPNSGFVRSEGDIFLNGAKPSLVPCPGVDSVFDASGFYSTWTMEAPSEALKEGGNLYQGRLTHLANHKRSYMGVLEFIYFNVPLMLICWHERWNEYPSWNSQGASNLQVLLF